MNRRLLLAAVVITGLAAATPALAGTPVAHWRAYRYGQRYAWHGYHYHTQWGQPVALVSPPIASRQTHWSWGVAQTSVTPVWHQFRRTYPGPYGGGMGFLGTPNFPSHTDQFGVYYVRGPW